MGGETLPMVVAVWCAGALAVESCVVVALARDQHSAARRMWRAIAVCAAALALVVAASVERESSAPATLGATSDVGVRASSLLLVAGWAVAALTIIEAGRGLALVAGHNQPMRLHASRLLGARLPEQRVRASWLREPALRSFGALGLAAIALIVVLRAGTANHTVGVGRAASVAVLYVDLALGCAVAVLWRGFSRRARGVLAFAAVLTCLQVAYMLLAGLLS